MQRAPSVTAERAISSASAGGKAGFAQHAEMEKILLRQHQRGRGLAHADRVDDLIGRAQIAARAAERGGNDEGEKTGPRKLLDVLEGKRRRLVVGGGAAAKSRASDAVLS